ncbi:hypothetical protein FHR80_002367 [Cellulomonas cellasea]|uniref:Uncharacterized protein n=1 Tax=Cellulomonas cellasea TaxID=43670 RepID=A0A7W4UFW9_9CELL|nr:hypothetical protein [Cellulomonas cellasea]
MRVSDGPPAGAVRVRAVHARGTGLPEPVVETPVTGRAGLTLTGRRRVGGRSYGGHDHRRASEELP